MSTQVVSLFDKAISVAYDIYIQFMEQTEMYAFIIPAFFILALVRLLIGPLVGKALHTGVGSDTSASRSRYRKRR